MLACLHRAFHHAFAHDGQRAGRAGHHDIVERQLFGKFIQRNRLPVETTRPDPARVHGAIGNSDVLRIARSKMRRSTTRSFRPRR